MEASRSLGLSYGKSMRLVVLPQAIRTMIPSIINQFIITLKDTSILSVIAFPELTNTGKTIAGNTFKVLQTLRCRQEPIPYPINAPMPYSELFILFFIKYSDNPIPIKTIRLYPMQKE
jgi:hypothetical protein